MTSHPLEAANVGSSDTFAAQNARRHWRCSFPIRFRIHRVSKLATSRIRPFPRQAFIAYPGALGLRAWVRVVLCWPLIFFLGSK
jgi:hypothetical protein